MVIKQLQFSNQINVFRIRYETYHLAGSTSGNVDPDQGSQKNVINSHTNIIK